MASNTVAPSPEDSQDQLGASTVSPDGLDTTPAENPTEDSAEPKKKSRRKLRKKQDKPEFDNLNMPPMQGPVLRRAVWREFRKSLLLFCFVSVYVELCLHMCVFKEIDGRIIYPILFALVGGSLMTFLCTLLPRIPGRILTVVLIAAEVTYAEVQLVYHSIFGNFMPISLAGMGENVVTNFGKQILYGIGQNIVPIVLLLIPLILVIVLLALHRAPQQRTGWKQSLTSVGIVAVISLILGGMLFSQKGETFSVYEIPSKSFGICFWASVRRIPPSAVYPWAVPPRAGSTPPRNTMPWTSTLKSWRTPPMTRCSRVWISSSTQ